MSVRPGPAIATRWATVVEHRFELLAWIAILVIAAALRLPDLGVRGTWDADQGHDMLVLRGLVLDGQIPLLGPPTSIGDFHHGVLYYVLLAPAALLSHADPVAVMTWIALGGVAAVAVTGCLARLIAGPLSGILAGLLFAISSSAVEESTFIWNPNLIALASSIALAAAWLAWSGGRARWWVVAGAAAVVTMHCHVLGATLTPVIAGLLVADVRRRQRRGEADGARSVWLAALAWIGLGLLSYVPLAIHELGSNASEVRGAIAFLVGGGSSDGLALPIRLPIVGLRVLGWPLAGLITASPVMTPFVASLVVGFAAWRGWIASPALVDRATGAAGPGAGPAVDWGRPGAAERTAVRWLALGLLWTIGALAVGATSLATVIVGLPNDHYHAFADPMVVVLVGVGIGALVRRGQDGRTRRARAAESTLAAADPGRRIDGPVWMGAAAALVVVLVAWNLANQPPARASDGGWTAAQAAAQRVLATSQDRPLVLSSLPTFKSDEAVRMPLVAAGAAIAPTGSQHPADASGRVVRVILCDQLFRASIGLDCGGPAEDQWLIDPRSGLLAATGTTPSGSSPSVDRFEAAPGRWISVYVLGP